MDHSNRYQKQELFSEVGSSGQRQLAQSTVLLVGCGALGCVLADSLCRAGIGNLRIVDRDFVEASNLQRQILFTERDVDEHLPKAVAARRRLNAVNSSVEVSAEVADVSETNILRLADGADLILDGTDNFEIRYLINDVSLETAIPWIFTGCTGSVGQMMPIVPEKTGCLRCLLPDAPPPGSTETCDTAGVLGPAVSTIASLQAALAIKLLIQKHRFDSEPELLDRHRKLVMVDAWDQSSRTINLDNLPNGKCPACCGKERLWLSGRRTADSTILCGRNAVQVSPASPMSITLEDVAERFESAANVLCNPFLVRATLEEDNLQLTVFPDGRAIVKGTEDPSVARSVVARWIGS